MQGDEHTMTDKQDTWQWQEPGTAWRGIGIYHITLTVTDRQPVLGTLVIPENDPKQARVEWSDLGRKVLGHMLDLPKRRPEIHIVSYCLMPDHLHAIMACHKADADEHSLCRPRLLARREEDRACL